MSLIVKESERLSKILDEFLSYARIDRPAYSKVELCHVIGEVIELIFHHKAYHPGIKVRLESSESIVYVVGDEDLLKQMLLNFALNSCEAIGTCPGELLFKLTADAERQTLSLQICDNGPGISADQLRRIYEPFHSTKKGGTGLGLAIVHRICQAMNLGLSVSSTPGQGTTFLIKLQPFNRSISGGSGGEQPIKSTGPQIVSC
jgi:signal transduction histidine kinase